jgi:tetratricopeptide (TPR) repeat protein
MVGTTSAKLAASLLALENEAESLAVQKQSMHSVLNRKDSGHPDVGLGYLNMASVYESQGRFDDAYPLFAKACDFLTASCGADHP